MKSKDLRLLLSMGSSRRLFLGALLGALVNTVLVITNAFLIAHLIIALIDSSADISTRIFQLALLWFFRAIYISTFDRWASFEASQLKNSLRSSIVDSPEILTHTPSTHLATLLVKGGNALDIYLARFLPQLFGAVITPIAVITTLFIQDWLSGLIALLTVPLIPIFGALIGKYTQVAVSKKWQSMGALGKYFEDSLRGIHTLALFSREKSQSQRIEEMGERYTNETMKVLRVSFLSALVLELAATISVALIAVSIGLRWSMAPSNFCLRWQFWYSRQRFTSRCEMRHRSSMHLQMELPHLPNSMIFSALIPVLLEWEALQLMRLLRFSGIYGNLLLVPASSRLPYVAVVRSQLFVAGLDLVKLPFSTLS
jgi:ABC-type multidrug transport system fused ATPase/permease subunit